MRKAFAILLCLAICLSVCSCSMRNIEFCELRFSLPRSFSEVDGGDSFDVALSDGEVFVGVLRISFDAAVESGIPATMTPFKLAEYYMSLTEKGDKATPVTEHGDVPYYCYVEENGGIQYLYMPTFYFSYYAYFIITFITPTSTDEDIVARLLSYTESVHLVYPEV